MRRDVYVISDLHLGGEHPTGSNPGFRMMTRPGVLAAFVRRLAAAHAPVELVINGDFLDFLAESDDGESWVPFEPDEARARALLHREFERDAEVFDALRDFVAAGHALTVLLGNHDLELSFPAVRADLEARVSPDRPIRFLYDGEAYVVGTALVEHGNRYDGYNVVDHAGLRAHRSSLSRGQPPRAGFVPPPGSRLVAEVMNPLKRHYPFVDLLKPENAALFALIAAIEPSARQHVKRLGALTWEAKRDNALGDDHQPQQVGQVANRGAGGHGVVAGRRAAAAPATGDDPLAAVLGALDAGQRVQQVGLGSTVLSGAGLLGLLAAKDRIGLDQRLPLVKLALRSLEEDRTFDPTVEPTATYTDAARALTRGARRFTHVVFGHTHHACAVDLGGATYLNSGTWANLMRFPSPLRGEPPTAAEAAREAANPGFDAADRDGWWLRTFVEDCRTGALTPYVTFRPSTVHLRVDDGVTTGRLVWLDPDTAEEIDAG